MNIKQVHETTRLALLAMVRAALAAYPQYNGLFTSDSTWKLGVVTKKIQMRGRLVESGTLLLFQHDQGILTSRATVTCYDGTGYCFSAPASHARDFIDFRV